MAEDETMMKGSCLCGAIQITVSAPIQLAEFCHCRTCRRATGAPVMAWAGFPPSSVTIEGQSLGRFQSSPGVERTFCGRCGSSLTISSSDFPDEMYVAIVALEDTGSITPEIHIWRSQRLPWFDTADELPRYLDFKRDGHRE